MASSASGQRTALRFTAEGDYGVPATTTYQALRFTGTSLNMPKETYQSNEIRADRQTADLRHGMRTAAGDVSFELSRGTFDELLSGALSGTWEAVTTGAVSLEADADDESFVRATGSFLADGFLPGDEVAATGFATAGNNGRAKVVAVTALSLTVDKALVADAAAAARTIALVGRRLKNGVALKTYSFERAFEDIGQYLLYRGLAINAMKLSVKPGEIVTGSVTLLGKDMVQATVSHATTLTPAGTASPFDAFTGSIREGGAVVANVTGVELDITNGRTTQGVIGERSPTEVHEGGLTVSGSLTAYFQDASLLNRFINEEESNLEVVLVDVNGVDFHRWYLPRVKYTTGDLDNPKEGPVVLSMSFTALVDDVSG
ncbi:phage tail tube protein, partial [Myxococcus sp. K38C18041901]|uniref:phage tail tube protein n=1 Tax=Myxococcus guangdongensis TaxID=2906760 RepID=UPI0020A72D73